jgi:N6-adenosine-specific RNA methylase IME4
MTAQAHELDVNLIDAAPTARVVMSGAVMALAESIKQIGLLQPISVRAKGDRYELIVGGHRLESVKVLGWSTVPAFLRTDDDLHAELALIDENLIRNELSPAERAMAVARRKKIYEALHPETKRAANKDQDGKFKPSRQVGDTERFTKATAKATGGSERGVQRDAHRGESLSAAVLAKATGTSLDSGEQLDALAKLQPAKVTELIDRAAAGEKVNAVAAVKAEKRDKKERDLGGKSVELDGRRKVNVLYVDCPWRFQPYSRETGMDRAPENHYPTMTLEQLLDLPVDKVTADDCVVFFWVTAPMMMEAIYVLNAWNFLDLRPFGPDGKLLRGEDGNLVDFKPNSRYVSQQVWGKDRIGTGYWFRNKHEILFVCVRGDIPAPTPGTQAESLISAAVQDHSRKPIIFRAMIERLFPTLPKLEMFARTPAPGWDQWGKEAPLPQGPVEEDINGDPITPTAPAEKREAKLIADAMAEASGEGEGLEIPAFLKLPKQGAAA